MRGRPCLPGPVWVKGAGDLATGVAWRLHMSGFAVFLTELPEPLCVRRAVAFAEAVSGGRQVVEGVAAVAVSTADGVRQAFHAAEVPVLVDPAGRMARALRPAVLIDAVMAKRNTGMSLPGAPVVIGLGPGFTAGVDCQAVIETNRGHWLGRAIYCGSAQADTGIPGELAGVRAERVVRAPVAGRFYALAAIGDTVAAGDWLGLVEPQEGTSAPVKTAVGGVVRGLIRSGIAVPAGLKVGDIDPTGEMQRCFTISEKALAVAGGVLEAVLRLASQEGVTHARTNL